MAHSNSTVLPLEALFDKALSENFPTFVGLVACAILLLCYSACPTKRNPRRLPLPPGPTGLPLIGNALQIVNGKSWEKYRDWATTFGDIIYLEAMGQPIIVLNSAKVINDLLESDKSINFSDRVRTPSLEMVGFTWHFGVCDYGSYWKENRRVFHKYFNAGQLVNYRPVLEHHATMFLKSLLENPRDLLDLAKYYVGAVVIQVSFGVDDPSDLAKLIDATEDMVQGFSEYVPAWAPGAAWKRKLLGYGARAKRTFHWSFEEAVERSRNGIQGLHANIADDIIPQLPDPTDPSYPKMEEIAKNAMLTASASGVDTTTQTTRALFLALAMYPDAQKRAQDELDQVVGHCRLPKPSDMGSLPFVAALVKELTRWHTAGPLGVPRRVRQDDEYNGYFIPKGTILLCNAWSLLHNPDEFDDPMEFRPERYLDNGKQSSLLQSDQVAFGYGRRKCPGMQFSNDTMMYMAASLLSVFNVSPATDGEGRPIPLKYDTSVELISKVTPYQVDIKPRSPEHANLLQVSKA